MSNNLVADSHEIVTSRRIYVNEDILTITKLAKDKFIAIYEYNQHDKTDIVVVGDSKEIVSKFGIEFTTTFETSAALCSEKTLMQLNATYVIGHIASETIMSDADYDTMCHLVLGIEDNLDIARSNTMVLRAGDSRLIIARKASSI